MENLSKSLHHYDSRRSLAWRKLDVCHLWRDPWCCVGSGALLLPSFDENSGRTPWSLDRVFLPLGSENSDLQCSLSEPCVLPGDVAHLGGATARRVVPFRLAGRVRRSILYALLIHCTFVPCRPSAGSRQSRIPICNLALCRSNRPRGRRTCRARIFFREQSQCVCLFPILRPLPLSTRRCLLEFAPFSLRLSRFPAAIC